MRRGARLIATCALVLLAAACRTYGDDVQATADLATTTTAPPTTTLPPTTTAPSTTVAPPTTPPAAPTSPPVAPAPTVAAATQRVPVAPPPEDGSTEPRVQLGTIQIPKIGLTAPMWEGIKLTTINLGPGHWPGTAMPGDAGNVVLAGHRVSHHADFRHVDQLAPGDDVVMTSAAGSFDYKVVSTEIVGPDAMWIVNQTADATGTLFACHPPGSTRERIVVHLKLAA